MVRPTYTNPNSTLIFYPESVESRFLADADEDMARLIESVGEVRVDIEADGFFSLARAICDQQISMAAARSIWARFDLLCEHAVTAEVVEALDVEAMRACGFSERKALYIKDLSRCVVTGIIDFERLAALDDEEIIEQLVQVKGIGRWTAEMFLIFALARGDVFALDDGGLRRSVCALKGLESTAPKAMIDAISQDWMPYRTCASLYLWRGLGQGVLQSL